MNLIIFNFLFIFFSLNSSSSAQNLDLQGLVNDAISTNKKEIVLPSGIYKVNPVAIYGANGLKIRGTGTRLVFDPTTPKYFDIQIENSNGITLQDLEIDNDPLPFTQGRVTKVDPVANSFEVELHAGYPTDYARFGYDCYVHIHDRTTRRFKQEGEMLKTSRAQAIPGGFRLFLIEEFTIAEMNLEVGDLVSIGQPGFVCAVSLYNTRNTLLDNIQIFSAQGCGVIENSGGGTSINKLTIKRGARPSGATEDRLLSINRDGMHLNGPNGGTTIRDSFVEFCGDDGINIRSEFSRIKYVNGNIIAHTIPHVNFETGTQLKIYDHTDLRLKDTVNVLEHQMGSDTARVDRTENISLDDLIVSPQHSQNFKILNNTFQDTDARGIVASGSNIYIEGNKIERSTMAGIWVGGELGNFDEGDFANGVYIRWNTVTDTNFALRGRKIVTPHLGAISINNEVVPYNSNYKYKRPNRNVWIVENTVSGSGLASLFIAETWNAGVCKNSFFNDNKLYFNNAGAVYGIDCRYSIVVHDASTVRLFQNWVIKGPNSFDMRRVTDSDTVVDSATNPCV